MSTTNSKLPMIAGKRQTRVVRTMNTSSPKRNKICPQPMGHECTKMVDACERGHIMCFKHHYKRESQVKGKEFRTKRKDLLITSVIYDHADIMKHIIEDLPKVHRRQLVTKHLCEGDVHINIMNLCCENDSIECMKCLVEEFNLFSIGNVGYISHRPLPHVALDHNSHKCLEYLAEQSTAGMGLHVDSSMGYNMGHYAAHLNSPAALKLYMDNYPYYLDAVSHKNHFTIEWILLHRGYWETFRWFRERRLDEFPDEYNKDISGDGILQALPTPEAITVLKPLQYFSFDARRDWFAVHSYAKIHPESEQISMTQINVSQPSKEAMMAAFASLRDYIIVPGMKKHLLHRLVRFTFAYDNQEAQGYGVVRQFMHDLIKHFPLDDILELTPNGDSHQWKKSTPIESRTYVRLLGFYCALQFILHERLTHIRLSSFMFTEDIIAEDLKHIDGELYESMVVYLRDCTEEELQALELSFTRTLEDGTEVEIMEGGSNFHPSKESEKYTHESGMLPLEAYLLLWVRHYITHERQIMRREFIKGFEEIVPHACLRGDTLFTAQEISQALWCDESTMKDVDIEKWKDLVMETPNSAPVRWFWDMVENHLTGQQRRCLLMFISGSTLLPESMEDGFTITVDEGIPLDQLPHARTCIKTLIIPHYATAQTLREKFNKVFESFAVDDMNFGFI